MIVVNYLAAVALFCIGLYAVLTRRNLIKMVMGMSMMEASTYLFMLSLAYRAGSTAPVLLNPPPGKTMQDLAAGNVADPVLQNFCLPARSCTVPARPACPRWAAWRAGCR